MMPRLVAEQTEPTLVRLRYLLSFSSLLLAEAPGNGNKWWTQNVSHTQQCQYCLFAQNNITWNVVKLIKVRTILTKSDWI